MKWKENYPKILFFIYLIIWVWAAIAPRYRSIWIDENILTVLFIGLLVLTYKRFRFSNLSYSLIFSFMVLHAIGGHYSYAEMPLFDYFKEVYGLSRNYYDRVVHFLFGVLFFVPIYEVMIKVFKVPKGWRGLVVAFFIVVALKASFEVIEYGYVWARADSLNVTNYLGEQGDTWDFQKDMFLGIFGGGISWIIIGLKKLTGFLYRNNCNYLII